MAKAPSLGYGLFMKTIPAGKFKRSCLSLLDKVDPDGVVITKRGKPVAKLVPFPTGSAELIGSLRGRIRIKGDIMSTGVKWDAES